jgi:hypothetical protein
MMRSVSIHTPPLLLLPLFLLANVLPVRAQTDTTRARHLLRITEGVSSPLRIAIDDRNVVYVTDAVSGKISKYDSTGSFLGTIAFGGSPLAVAITPEGRLYVGDRVSGELQLLDATGSLLKKVAKGATAFALPSSAAMDNENRLYVVDGKKKQVSVFDAGGNFVGSFGEGILAFPTGIAFDQRNQRVLVAEHGGLNLATRTKMIHVFDRQGNWLQSLGEYGSKTGQFTRIQGLAVDRWGRIYVADPFQGVVSVLSEEGALLATVGQFGADPGELRAPMDVAIDSGDRLWVASMNNGSLEVYDVSSLPTGVTSNPPPTVPTRTELLQNYPNPFNPGTWIPFTLSKDSRVVIRIYNRVGKLVRTFDLGKRQRGSYTTEGRAVYWDGTNDQGELVASGVYFYEIRTDISHPVRRMLLLK